MFYGIGTTNNICLSDSNCQFVYWAKLRYKECPKVCVNLQTDVR